MAVLYHIQHLINIIVDWLYRPFKRFVPKETFKYAVCGGANTAFDIFLYFITYNFILQKKIINLKLIAISPHIASFLLVFPITFSTGFLLSKYITFTSSTLRGKTQLLRYGFTVLVCIFLNYILLKLFVEGFGWYPTPSKIATTCLVVIYSYFSQRHFTFKTQQAV
ncbi:MAG TPA: GtrA family protein [Bacteroidales bacterium]|nr:GtrA family protein [Bacteroidales bacterium]